MKVDISIDCSPEEARAFLGLPAVAPMQEALLREIEARMQAAMRGIDAETLLKTWLPAGFSGLEEMQKSFWRQFAAGASGGNTGAAGKGKGGKA